MASLPQHLSNGQWLDITSADPAVDAGDIVLIAQALVELFQAGAHVAPRPDRATCDRLARLLAPYVSGATAEQLGDWYDSAPDDIPRTLRYVLIRMAPEGPPT